jgi:hypothetical protein
MVPIHVEEDDTAPSPRSTSEPISDDETPISSIAFEPTATHDTGATVRRSKRKFEGKAKAKAPHD